MFIFSVKPRATPACSVALGMVLVIDIGLGDPPADAILGWREIRIGLERAQCRKRTDDEWCDGSLHEKVTARE